MDSEEPTGWRRLLHTTVAEEMTVAQLSEATGLSRATVSKQLSKSRWGIAPTSRALGQGGPQRYPTAPILEWAAGPGKGNRTTGDVRRQAALRVAPIVARP